MQAKKLPGQPKQEADYGEAGAKEVLPVLPWP
jgi:hypothetical protein